MPDPIKSLVQRLEEYNAAYRQGRPLVSDAEYDTLVEELREKAPDHPFLSTVEPEQFAGKQKIKHPVPMLSTDKAYTVEDLARFVTRVEKAGAEIGETDLIFRVTAKLDGLAGRDDGTILVSRGNGRFGFDITSAFDKGVIPVGGRGLGLGEIVMTKSYFDEHLAGEFEHPRNLVVGIVASDQVNESAQKALAAGAVHFVPYAGLPAWQGTGRKLVETTQSVSEQIQVGIDYPMDGLVAEVENQAVKERMGATNHHYRWQIAIKGRGETAVTTVYEITWQVGRTGNVTPVMEVEPVRLSGATIRRVTAHNAGTIEKLGIGPGAEIEIIRSGEVIPKLETVHRPAAETVLPTQCPSCGASLVRQNDFLRCPNAEACRDQLVQRIRYWFNTLGNADWFGVKTVEKLVDAGFDHLEKIYAMGTADFETLGFGPVQSRNLAEATVLSRTQPVEDWRFLAAFGISNLGLGDSRKLLRHIPLELLPETPATQIRNIGGFGEITGQSIETGFRELHETITAMLGLGFRLERTPVTERAFLSTLGLPEFSDEVMTEILSRHSLLSLLDADGETLASMAGVDAVAADRFLRALKKNGPLFEKLKSRGIELVREVTPGSAAAKNPISGKAVVFTGKMVRGSREEMQEAARRLGAKVQTAVAQSTDYLVCGEKVGAKKMEKARAAGVTILSEAEFFALVEGSGQD